MPCGGGGEYRLTIIGSGPEEPRIRHWTQHFGLEKSVQLAGKADFEGLKQHLSTAHAYVQSSLAEGFSNAVAEAMALGCPVFATDVGGTAEIIQDGKNGFLLPALEPGSWAAKLALAGNYNLMQRVRAAAFETARQHFSAEVHARKFTAFYRRALAACPKVKDYEPQAAAPKPSQSDELLQDRPLLVQITGPWEWQSGADQALRAVMVAARTLNSSNPAGRILALVCGCGSQEDELRYLAHLPGSATLVQFQFLNDANDLGARFPGSPPAAEIRLPDTVSGFFEICSHDGHAARVPFGDVQGLSQGIAHALAPSPANVG
ncbi:MAG TPA: glycosyltransferase family 4 protein [Candidatus Paceibacterota bacterium]|nr:glycosyltransferase family 4 protein [Candidatus Paceibacterota bacterium]